VRRKRPCVEALTDRDRNFFRRNHALGAVVVGMQTRTTTRLALGSLALALGAFGCGAGSTGEPLRVGWEPAHVADSGADGIVTSAAGSGATSSLIDAGRVASTDTDLTAEIDRPDGLRIELVTVECKDQCAQVVAVAHGGNPPYTFSWEDGSTVPMRSLCPTADHVFSVRATDTPIDQMEFRYAAHTASADVTARVLDCPSTTVQDVTVYWANWSNFSVGSPGTCSAVLSPPSGDIALMYSGEVSIWTPGLPSAANQFTPESTYLSASVKNGPPNAAMITVSGDETLTQVIAFSEPVRDPLLAIWSLGSLGTASSWEFAAEPTLLSSGPAGYSAGIPLPGTMLSVTGHRVDGIEGSGVVQFSGMFTTLRFTVPVPEPLTGYGGFTVGIRAQR
jgi:hypothetical protein